MATETVTADPGAPADELRMPENWAKREDLSLNALFEIQQLTKVVRRVLASERDEESANVLARGMLRRIEELADSVYSLVHSDPNFDGRSVAEVGALIRAEPERDVSLGEVSHG